MLETDRAQPGQGAGRQQVAVTIGTSRRLIALDLLCLETGLFPKGSDRPGEQPARHKR
jgi:hypothetical protein